MALLWEARGQMDGASRLKGGTRLSQVAMDEVVDIKKWIVFYPIYINSKKTIAQGRRISASKACENPKYDEIYDCCRHLQLRCAPEKDKAYPRDFMERGRVRVLLKKEDGTLYNPAVATSMYLYFSFSV
ncbi:hypothetical protein IFM89_027138 [Coptis chinensis]|uniref:Signal recognition particle 19 kDa protein n=1 Tax=Coptis chinensis TaxID=261450 RepID=A0A835IYK8_9MAGN|nr:hypothetical protein IFM89_027138 [Coptis chinensis]